MTGAEHYREAEERLRASDYQRQEGDIEGATHEAAVAQAHATLALAAATALGIGGDDPPPEDAAAWWRVAGTHVLNPGRPEQDDDEGDGD